MAQRKKGLGQGSGTGSVIDEITSVTDRGGSKPVVKAKPKQGGHQVIRSRKKRNLTCSLLPATIDKLQAIGYWDRVAMSAVIEGMLIDGIKKLEKKKGAAYDPIPTGSKLKTGRPAKAQ